MKFSGRVTREDATSFRASIQALLDEEYVRSRGNAVLKEIYPELLEALLDDSYGIHAFLACGGQVRKGARTYADAEGSQDWHFNFDNAAHMKEIRLRVLDLGELATLRNQLMASANLVEPEVVMDVPIVNGRPSLHHMGGDFTAVQVTVPAKVLIDAYDRYRSEIFRFNPRGPLGSNKANKEIQKTLEDPVLKRHFHLLNNGLTAICDSVAYVEDSDELEVKSFQVVNGCQTVFTLYQLREHITDEVKVSIRIVEGLQDAWGAAAISKASNYQTAVKPEQLASLGSEHDRIKDRFDKLQPPWFYEKQRGYKRFLSATDKRLHGQRYGRRIISASELGQYGVAFLGNPILAKYDLQRLFEQADLEGDSLYRAIFMEDNHAAQLVLPVLVGRRVYQAVKERISQLKSANDEGQQGFSELNWLPFARMHIVGLVGEQLKVGTSSSKGELLEASTSLERWQSMDVWFDNMFGVAKDAVEFFIEVEKRADKLHNLRNFFRDRVLKNEMFERVSKV